MGDNTPNQDHREANEQPALPVPSGSAFPIERAQQNGIESEAERRTRAKEQAAKGKFFRNIENASLAAWSAVFVAACGCAVAVTQCTVNREQVLEMRAAAKSGDEQFKVLNRPYVLLESVSFDEIEAGKPIVARIIFRNGGKTPAVNATWRNTITPIMPTEAAFDKVAKESRNAPSKMIIGEDKSYPAITDSIASVNKDFVEDVSSGRIALYFWGVFTYRSVWEKDADAYHTTTFCIVYNPKSPVGKRSGFGAASGNDIK